VRYRFTPGRGINPARGDPATARGRSIHVKSGIHPDYVVTTVTCTCGSTFTTRSTAKNGVIHADVCSECHPFYTGKQKILDTGGRVARFERRFGKKPVGGPEKASPEKASTEKASTEKASTAKAAGSK
jgi:large subunit ribosomal protein L31